jgi:hypothetical protein
MPTQRRFAPGFAGTPTILSAFGRRPRRLALLGWLVAVAAAGCSSGDLADPDGGADGGMSDGAPAQGGHPSSPGTGGMGGGPTSRGGAGGIISEIPSAAACVYDGRGGPGGSDLIFCHNVTVVFSPPATSGHTFDLSTDLPSTPALSAEGCGSFPCAWKDWTKPDTSAIWMDLRQGSTSPDRFPTTLRVRVRGPEGTVEQTFSDLHYRCVDRTSDDWCWEAEPVTFELPATTKP